MGRAAAIWAERYRRALQEPADDGRPREFSARHRELIHAAIRALQEPSDEPALIDGHWQPNPHQGDQERARRREREVWAEMGEWLGIGPPPEDFYGQDG